MLEHKHCKQPLPHAHFDPMDLMTMIPQEAVDRQAEEVGEDSALLVDLCFDAEEDLEYIGCRTAPTTALDC